ncbi:hypothetical protein CGLO_11237 [Colletotrichum gloeosporioides Cg-14]|jgi:tryptophan synthase alpha subunit
MRII